MILRLAFVACLVTASAALAEEYSFPPRFLWGTATAAHQVEGGNVKNDWWLWEQTPGHIRNGDRSTISCDHYNRYAQDLDLARQIHSNGYRFSIEWSRIEPADGVFDPVEIEHYRKMLLACRERGIVPMVTLFHFTLPQWAAAMGSFESPQVVDRFVRFCERMAREYGDLVDLWCTENEPMGYVVTGYGVGLFPPGKTGDFLGLVRAIRNLISAHARAYRAIHAADRIDADGDGKPALVGIAQHLRPLDPFRPRDPRDVTLTRIADVLFNKLFFIVLSRGRVTIPMPDGTEVTVQNPGAAGTMDYVGVNYYTRNYVRFNSKRPLGIELMDPPPGVPLNDYKWEIYPEGFYRVLMYVKSLKRPIYVTENGISDAADTRRAAFIRDHLCWLIKAMKEGADVRGYFHWSLMDNFEWIEGYAQRFGLFKVDFATQARTLTAGGRFYSEVAGQNGMAWSDPDLPPAPLQ